MHQKTSASGYLTTFGFVYRSPSQGEMRFGWDRLLQVKDCEIAITEWESA